VLYFNGSKAFEDTNDCLFKYIISKAKGAQVGLLQPTDFNRQAQLRGNVA
jgi:hypothetical protein